MITPPFLVLFVASLLFLYLWESWFGIPIAVVVFIYGAIIASVGMYAVVGLRKKHQRISSLEMLVWPIFVVGYCFNFIFQIVYQDVLFTLP